MYSIENNKLKVAIKKTGAELCKITSVKNNTEFMWDGNPDIWNGTAPNLFPIIGALKENSYMYENKIYTLPKHGFVRHSEDIELFEETKNSLTFKLSYNDGLLKIYPFKFEFYITFKLIDNTLEISHTVKNTDDMAMYFSVGGHPHLNVPCLKTKRMKITP